MPPLQAALRDKQPSPAAPAMARPHRPCCPETQGGHQRNRDSRGGPGAPRDSECLVRGRLPAVRRCSGHTGGCAELGSSRGYVRGPGRRWLPEPGTGQTQGMLRLLRGASHARRTGVYGGHAAQDQPWETRTGGAHIPGTRHASRPRATDATVTGKYSWLYGFFLAGGEEADFKESFRKLQPHKPQAGSGSWKAGRLLQEPDEDTAPRRDLTDL